MPTGESDRIQQANGYGIDVLKQITALSSGILALTITFIKDALGDARADAILIILVPVSWLFLSLSVLFAWVATVEVSNTIATFKDKVLYVFDRSSKDEKVQRCLRFARYSQVGFVVGLLLLTLFAVLNFQLFFRPSKSMQSISNVTQTSPTVVVINSPVPSITPLVLSATTTP